MSNENSAESVEKDCLEEMTTCKNCKGFAVGFASNSLELCHHCLRETKAYFDPDNCEYCSKQGFVDISPNANGLLLKKVLKEGEHGQAVEEGCPTFVQYVGRLTDGTIFDTTRDVIDGKHVGGTDDLFEFQLGREKVIKGWDIGVATMNRGEISRFIIKPEYAYGHQGFAPKVEPGATLDFEIELVKFKDPLPRFPSQAELAQSKKEREEQERKEYEENPPPTIDERIKNSMAEKERGNSLIAEGNFSDAQKAYDGGFVNIFISKEEWEHLVSDEDKQKINNMKLPLHLNRALCKLKLDKFEDALWDCDKAIEIDSENVKANFRRGLVYIAKLKVELEKEKKKEFWLIQKATEFSKQAEISLNNSRKYSTSEDRQVVRALNDLRRCNILLSKYEKDYHKEEKRLYKDKIMSQLEEKNKILQKKEKAKEIEEEFADMPPLE